jgi:hypothetical protein
VKNLEEAITKTLDIYNAVTFRLVAKRLEVGGVRDWHGRVMWKAEGSEMEQESVWDGFATEQEAFDDFIAWSRTLS